MRRKIDRESLPYRPCVGIVLVNPEGKVFVGRRIDQRVAAWQFPQGGIDGTEEPRAAALRELAEEIGTDAAEVIGESRGWFDYELPDDLLGKVWKGKYRGQRQKWYAMRFLGDDDEIDLNTAHPEFDAWKWVPLADVPSLIVPFKRSVYHRVVEEFRDLVHQVGSATKAVRTKRDRRGKGR